MPPLMLWAQSVASPLPNWLQWLIVWGDPAFTEGSWLAGFFGGFMTWAKLLGLFCLISWLGSRFFGLFLRSQTATKQGGAPRLNLPLIGLATFVGLALLAAFLTIGGQANTLRLPAIRGYPIAAWLVGVNALLAFLALEAAMWSRARRQWLLALAVHLALAGGVFVVLRAFQLERAARGMTGGLVMSDWQLILANGLRYGGTFAGLAVLLYYGIGLLFDAFKVRWRRLYSIAWQTILDAGRRMQAPWVVLALFVLVLAFINWFLGEGTSTAVLASRYIDTLAWTTSMLLSLMILLLAPFSIPNDIRHQTIYTVATKPVTRLELIWGRLIGYMGLVTGLLLVMGVISLVLVDRVVDNRIRRTREQAQSAQQLGKTEEAARLEDQASQLEAKKQARVPVYGFLSFIDSRGRARKKGIDVGQEERLRSHIEGASASKATWKFGVAPRAEGRVLGPDNILSVSRLLQPGTLEWVEDRYFQAFYEQNRVNQGLAAPNLTGADRKKLEARLARADAELKQLDAERQPLIKQNQALQEKLRQAESGGDQATVRSVQAEISKLHSRPIPVDMTFNIFRTSKGELGEAVRASMVVTNPMRPDQPPARLVFPIEEFYTVRRFFPARLLVGSMGQLNIDIQCVTPSQFIGVSEKDLYLVSNQGSFATNFLASLMGVWLQALVITAVGLFAGTFLSWRVAFLLTLMVFIAGQLAIGFLDQFNQEGVMGGGPFESMIRLIGHENLQTDLASTPAVVAAKSFDLFLTPILTRLVYLVPNLVALDMSNLVAEGFAVTGASLLGHVLLGLGYALPLTAFAYYIFKNRELAA